MRLWMLLWSLLALVLLVVAVVGIAALVRHLSNPSAPGTQTWQQVALLIRQHAHYAVSEFVARGMDRAMQLTPLAAGFRA